MPGRGRGRKGKGSKGEGEGEPSSATSTPSSSSSPRKSTSGEATPSASGSGPKPPVDKDATPEESPHDAKVEEDAEIFLTAITPDGIRDESCRTFIFKKEGHTLGNALRFVISNYPEVTFCGHTIPHPSENEMHLRIQTTSGTSAVTSLRKGLQDLVEICDHTESVLDVAMKSWGKDHPESVFQVPAPPGPAKH